MGNSISITHTISEVADELYSPPVTAKVWNTPVDHEALCHLPHHPPQPRMLLRSEMSYIAASPYYSDYEGDRQGNVPIYTSECQLGDDVELVRFPDHWTFPDEGTKAKLGAREAKAARERFSTESLSQGSNLTRGLANYEADYCTRNDILSAVHQITNRYDKDKDYGWGDKGWGDKGWADKGLVDKGWADKSLGDKGWADKGLGDIKNIPEARNLHGNLNWNNLNKGNVKANVDKNNLAKYPKTASLTEQFQDGRLKVSSFFNDNQDAKATTGSSKRDVDKNLLGFAASENTRRKFPKKHPAEFENDKRGTLQPTTQGEPSKETLTNISQSNHKPSNETTHCHHSVYESPRGSRQPPAKMNEKRVRMMSSQMDSRKKWTSGRETSTTPMAMKRNDQPDATTTTPVAKNPSVDYMMGSYNECPFGS